MNRRSNKQVGFVNFPIDSPEYKNTGEGGMFVSLVVDDAENFDDRWILCCGGYCQRVYDESYIGDDADNPEDFHYPDIKSDKDFYVNGKFDELAYENKYRSAAYLFCATIGSTGWSGYNHNKGEHGEYFKCTYDNLTEDGKAFYNQVKALYGDKCKLYLITWLDT